MIKNFYFCEDWAFSVDCDKHLPYCPVITDTEKHGIGSTVTHITDCVEEQEIRLDKPLLDIRYKDTLINMCQKCPLNLHRDSVVKASR